MIYILIIFLILIVVLIITIILLLILNTTTSTNEVHLERISYDIETQDIRINIKELKQLKPLGGGGFGTVYEGLWRGQKVAIKKYSVLEQIYQLRDTLQEYDDFRRFKMEVEIICGMSHPNIVQGYGIVEIDGYPLSLVMELALGSLEDVLQKERYLRNWTKITLFQSLLDALVYLHENDIIHRDIKPANILYFGEDLYKLTDMDLCRDFTGPNSNITAFVGTLKYMAPEVRQGDIYDSTLDTWSMGMVLIEICIGLINFFQDNVIEYINMVSKIHPYLRDILVLMVAENPDERATITEIHDMWTFNFL